MSLTTAELDRMGCMSPGCTHEAEVLAQKCHPQAGLMVRYVRTKRALEMTCKRCAKFVAAVAV